MLTLTSPDRLKETFAVLEPKNQPVGGRMRETNPSQNVQAPTEGLKKRSRAGKNLKAKFHIHRPVVLLDNPLTFRPSISYPLRFERYRPQEAILHSVDEYVRSTFDQFGMKWRSGYLGFVRSEGDVDRQDRSQLPNWQLHSDQTYGASTLINAGLHGQAQKTLDQFYSGVKDAVAVQDPSIMVKFWRICLELRGIDGRGRYNALDTFLAVLEEASIDQFGPQQPLSRLITSLRQVAPWDFKDTLRIGFDMTLQTMVPLIGDENAWCCICGPTSSNTGIANTCLLEPSSPSSFMFGRKLWKAGW